MARVTQLGGLALPNSNATAHEYTQGVCGTVGAPGLARGLSWPNPALARGGERSRARPWRGVSRTAPLHQTETPAPARTPPWE